MTIPKTFNEKNQCIFKVKDTEIIIDEGMFFDIIKYKWYINNEGYIQGYIEGKNVILSRYIMNYTGELLVDHINNNKLDNRKKNLRLVDSRKNAQNRTSRKGSSSQYVGVSWHKRIKKWGVSMKTKNKTLHLGYFTNEIEAAKARDKATFDHFGIFGNLNFPEDYSEIHQEEINEE